MKHLIDIRSAFVLALINALIVYAINSRELEGATQAAVVQVVVNFCVVAVVMPRIRQATNYVRSWQAYLTGAIVLPFLALLFSTSMHAFFGTPNMIGTTIFLILATLGASGVYVVLKRNANHLPAFVQKLVIRL